VKTPTEPRDSGAPPRTTAYHELGHEYLVITDPRVDLIDPDILDRHPPIQRDAEHHELTYLRRTFHQQHEAVANAIARFGFYPLDVPKHLIEDIKAMPGILACRAYSRSGEVKPYQHDYFAITRDTYEDATAFLTQPRPMNRDQRLAIQDLLRRYNNDPNEIEPAATQLIEDLDVSVEPLEERVAAYQLDYETAERLVQFTRQPSKRQRELVRELVANGRAHPHFLPGVLRSDPRCRRDEDRSLKKADPGDQRFLDNLIDTMSAGTASEIIDAGFAHASSDQRTQLRGIFKDRASAQDIPASLADPRATDDRGIWEMTQWEAKAALDSNDNALFAQMREDENAEELAHQRQERSDHFYETRVHAFDVEPYIARFTHHQRTLPREGTYFGEIVAIVKQGNSIRYAMLHLPENDHVLELQRSNGRGFHTYLSDLLDESARNTTQPADYLDSDEFQQAYRGKVATVRISVKGRNASANITVLPDLFQQAATSPELFHTLSGIVSSPDNLRTTTNAKDATLQYVLSAIEIRPSSSAARIGTPLDVDPGTNAQYLGVHQGHHFIQTTYTNIVSAVDPDDIGFFDRMVSPGDHVIVGVPGKALTGLPDIYQSISAPQKIDGAPMSEVPVQAPPLPSQKKRASRTKQPARTRSH